MKKVTVSTSEHGEDGYLCRLWRHESETPQLQEKIRRTIILRPANQKTPGQEDVVAEQLRFVRDMTIVKLHEICMEQRKNGHSQYVSRSQERREGIVLGNMSGEEMSGYSIQDSSDGEIDEAVETKSISNITGLRFIHVTALLRPVL